jgi:hypothetical protein
VIALHCTAEVVEVVRYKGPINATIIRRHQQWLDAAQVCVLGAVMQPSPIAVMLPPCDAAASCAFEVECMFIYKRMLRVNLWIT